MTRTVRPPALTAPRVGAAVSATELYENALRAHLAGVPVVLAAECAAWTCELPVAAWCTDADQVEVAALDRLSAALPPDSAVLDLGCGPGRHGAHLAGRGLQVLGVDTSAVAVALTQRRGVPALLADALGRLPDGPSDRPPGWGGVLLLDGNIGIGGDPLLLLCRVRDLLAPAGRVLIELHPGGGGTDRQLVRLRAGVQISTPFNWARLSGAELPTQARCAGLAVLERWCITGRTFGLLGRAQP